MLKDMLHTLVLSEVFFFINMAIYEGSLEADFTIDFANFPKYHFYELGEFDGAELQSMWDKSRAISELEKAGYSVTCEKTNYSTVLFKIKY